MNFPDKETQVRVGMCMYGPISPPTARGMMDIARVVPNLCVDMEQGSFVAPARNRIALRAKEAKDKYLLFIDSDMAFSVDDMFALFKALKENPKMGAICGNYVRRDGSGVPICNWVDSKTKFWTEIAPQSKRIIKYLKKKAIVPVDVFGAGFLLVDVRVFDHIEYPFFEAKHIEGLKEDEITFATEDHWFVNNLKKKGYTPSVHFGANVGHRGEFTFYPSIEGLNNLIKQHKGKKCNSIAQPPQT